MNKHGVSLRIGPWTKLMLFVLGCEVLGALAFGIGLYNANSINHEEQTIHTLVQENAALLQRQQAAQASQAVIKKFTDEINFICQIVATNAQNGGTVIPPRICSVSFGPPTPTPAP